MYEKFNSELQNAISLKKLIETESAVALAETATDEARESFYSKAFTIAFGDEKFTAACGPEIMDAVLRALETYIDYFE